MKTTQEQRDAWKMKRRFSGWRDLLADIHRRARRSGWTLEVTRRALEGVQMNGCLPQIQDAIRRAN